jgi:hypothetical protein
LHWLFLSFFREREPVLGPPETPDSVGLDKVAVAFKECEDDSEPMAKQIEANEQERADWFKCDQLLPITG